MITLIIILLVLLPVTFLPLTLDTFFSPAELGEMGVCLENPESAPSHCPLLSSDKTNLQIACGHS